MTIVDIETPESPDDFNELYLISPLFDKDLEFVLSSDVDLEESHVQFFMHQMLCAMKYMHSARVLHRDLKPGNILLQENCDVAVCDLGLARYIDASFDDEKQAEMTEYVVTRWYRAPELVLCPDYTMAVDMWALGCIFAEILGREPIFQGKDFKNQIEVITKILGKPYGSEMRHIKSAAARKFLEDLPPNKGVPFQKLFPKSSEEAMDLLTKMLKFAPHERITAEKALEHPFLKTYHRPKREPSAPQDMDFSILEPKSASGEEFTELELRTLLLKEVSYFRGSDPLFQKRPDLKGE